MVYIKDYEYSSMTRIGDAAFKNCSKLERFGSDSEFALPGYLETIGVSAFEGCESIEKVTLPDTVADKTVTGADGAASVRYGLGEAAFKNCTGIVDLTLSGVETISKSAFENCISLLSVKFANGNKVIGVSAFRNCCLLSEVRFSSSVNKICENAFASCSRLTYVDINSSC